MGKKTAEKKVTFAESFIQFQIDVKNKEIEEFKEEVRELEAKNQQLLELQDQLRKEQQEQLSLLCKQAKEQVKKLKEKEVANNEQEEQTVQHNLELAHIQEKELAELYRQLTNVQVQVVEQQVQWQAWQLYKNMGSVEHQQRIQKLQSRLDCIQKTFQAESERIEDSLKSAICEIDKKTSDLIEKVEQLATETALKQADKHSFQKIRKNKWLKKKIAVYHGEVSVMDAVVRNLEEENLGHIKQLFDHLPEDVQISSNPFLTQAEDLEQKHSLPERAAEIGREQPQRSGELEEDETDYSCKPSSPTHHLSTLLYGSQSDLREPLHLEPLEQKLLSVVGRAIPQLHEQDGTLTMNIIHRRFQ